jgi:hypothetical protein
MGEGEKREKEVVGRKEGGGEDRSGPVKRGRKGGRWKEGEVEERRGS